MSETTILGYKTISYSQLVATVLFNGISNIILITRDGQQIKGIEAWLPSGLSSPPDVTIGQDDPQTGHYSHSYFYSKEQWEKRFAEILVPESEPVVEFAH